MNLDVKYVPDPDRQWMRKVITEAHAAAPHHAIVTWAPAERGVPQWSAVCSTCGQISTGSDKAAMSGRAEAHNGG
jgi:hypothetical protein